MKRLLLLTVLCPFGLWSSSTAAMEAELPAQETIERSATIDAVLSEIQAGVDGAQLTLQRAGTCATKCPRLQTVEVMLHTVLKRVGNSGFKFLIFSFGKKIETSQVQTVVLNLKPPPPASGQALKPTLSTLLSNAIVDVVQGVEKAEAHESVPLQLDTFSVEISFVVSVEDSGGFEGLKVSILPIDIDFKRSKNLTSGNTHTVKVTFGRSELAREATAIGSALGDGGIADLYNAETGEYAEPVVSLEKVRAAAEAEKRGVVDLVPYAILDTGILSEHPWIKRQTIVAQKDFTGEGIQDQNGHGTYVALQAITNCFNCKHKLIIAKVLDKTNRGHAENIAAAMKWAAEQGAINMNMSFCVPRASWGSEIVCDVADELYHKYPKLLMVAAECNDPALRPSCPADASSVIGITQSDTFEVRFRK